MNLVSFGYNIFFGLIGGIGVIVLLILFLFCLEIIQGLFKSLQNLLRGLFYKLQHFTKTPVGCVLLIISVPTLLLIVSTLFPNADMMSLVVILLLVTFSIIVLNIKDLREESSDK